MTSNPMLFSFAHFIAGDGAPVLDLYRNGFKPSAGCPAPLANVGVFVLCAESEARAEELALARDVWRMRVDRGTIAPFPSLEEARAEAEAARAEEGGIRVVRVRIAVVLSTEGGALALVDDKRGAESHLEGPGTGSRTMDTPDR